MDAPTQSEDVLTNEPTAGENARSRVPPFHRRQIAEQELISEISNAAQSIAEARDWNGELVYRTDGIWRVLAAVARSPYCLAIADLGRALRVRKQTAHELAHAAARAQLIDLEPNPQDRRLLQLLLTPRGRSELAAARTAESIWLATLLNGLGDHELAATTRVVRVIRQRLERAEREWARLEIDRSKP